MNEHVQRGKRILVGRQVHLGLGRELERVLSGLKPKQRQVFVLFEIEELPLARIAEILDCPLETVRSRLRHAREDVERLRLRREMTP